MSEARRKYIIGKKFLGREEVRCTNLDEKNCKAPCRPTTRQGIFYCNSPQGGINVTLSPEEAINLVSQLLDEGKIREDDIYGALERQEESGERYSKAGVRGGGARKWKKAPASPRFKAAVQTRRGPKSAALSTTVATASTYDDWHDYSYASSPRSRYYY